MEHGLPHGLHSRSVPAVSESTAPDGEPRTAPQSDTWRCRGEAAVRRQSCRRWATFKLGCFHLDGWQPGLVTRGKCRCAGRAVAHGGRAAAHSGRHGHVQSATHHKSLEPPRVAEHGLHRAVVGAAAHAVQRGVCSGGNATGGHAPGRRLGDGSVAHAGRWADRRGPRESTRAN